MRDDNFRNHISGESDQMLLKKVEQLYMINRFTKSEDISTVDNALYIWLYAITQLSVPH